ncbi:MAG: hypothetical protein ABID38_02320 [Candidatus Diapherotrites archaeon]
MAFWFTHALVAFGALQKLEKKDEFSSFEQIDDYLFGAVAPDIRYLGDRGRNATHEPFGGKSAFEAFHGKNCSAAFLSGYESHLVCDKIWGGESEELKESVYDFFNLNPSNLAEKFSLYFFVDDYFQGQGNWFYPLLFAGNVFRANETTALRLLDFNDNEINSFKLAASLFLKEPGMNFFQALNLARIPLEEKAMSEIVKSFTSADEYLNRFLEISIGESAKAINGQL